MTMDGRWTCMEPAKLLVGAEGGTIEPPKKRNPWKAAAVVIGIGAAIYFFAPGTQHFIQHGSLPDPDPKE